MMRFGPSGTDAAFCALHKEKATTIKYLGWLGQSGLSAFEINFTRGVRIGEVTAKAIGEVARANNISVSGHAPYFINLANPEPAAFAKNYAYIADSLAILRAIGAPDDDGRFRLVVHVGSQCDLIRDEAIANCRRNLGRVIEKLKTDARFAGGDFPFLLCIETMGRYKQIGNIEEIVYLCGVDKCVVPTIDFGHVNCLEQGALRTNLGRIGEILDYCTKHLGEKMKRPHIHFSAIVYTVKGEHTHTTLDDARWNFPYGPLAEYIRTHKLEPIVICESKGRQALDAIELLGHT